jgi:hypothetical protein
MMPPHTLAELSLDVHQELRDLRFKNAGLRLALRELLAALKLYAEWMGPACDHATRDDCPIEGCPGRPVDDAVNAAALQAEEAIK